MFEFTPFKGKMEKNLNKQLFRNKIKQALSCLSEIDIQNRSQKIHESLFSLVQELFTTKQSDKLNYSIYYSLKNEVQTLNIIKKLLTLGSVWLPRCNNTKLDLVEIKSVENLEVGSFNILEPKAGLDACSDYNHLDIMIVPALAFDVNCNRLGRGRGFYDKLLKELCNETTKIGLAFDEQLFEHIPCEDHDEKVDCIITQSRIITNRLTSREAVTSPLERRDI